MSHIKRYAPIGIILIVVCYNIYLAIVSDPATRATYFTTIVVLAIYLVDQITKLPPSVESRKKDEVPTPTVDLVSEAQEWVKGRLTGIDIRRWGIPKVLDDGKGNVEVSGTVDRTYPHDTYHYHYHKKDGKIESDSFVDWLKTYIF
jgi:hypothetical protein